ncbi:polysaccharide pyruvyl transferase family protein [Natrialba aegyptia]|uniref:Polysaccharide pyruvyl transferase n=1 Tax=Natrialba aegyptia DSM 13077 TaxID=1227491 RepID=M0AYE2_9EURY|nr:polysaccharide pyruvyl transferase family protein [Natrialba aegyptia]ELZ03347.1 polysaccharide pyruvyl transferase [Natrialba aegyptia DSM 13077]
MSDLEAVGSVLIDGFYGHRNAGDEAILAALIQQIRSYDPDADIIVSSSDPIYTKTLHDVDGCITRYQPQNGFPSRKWLSTVCNVDQVWIGGGGLFGHRKMLKYSILIAIARAVGARVATVSVGSGPFANQSNKLAQPMLSHAAAVTVRDKQTASRLRNVGVSGPIDVCVDPVFGYEFDVERITLSTSLSKCVGSKTIVVSVREPSDREVDEPALANALTIVAKNQDCKIIFIPFHVQRGGATSDIDIAQRIATRMLDVETIVWDDELTYEEIIAVIDRSRLVVGMRLHSIIFAALVRTPFVGIPYAPKCIAHLQRLHAPTSLNCDDLDSASLASEIEAQWETGLSAKTKNAIEDCEMAAQNIIPRVQSKSTNCSRTRVPLLFAKTGITGFRRMI